jgi:hypothetical protein
MIISAHDDNVSAPPRLTLLVHLCLFYNSSFKRQGLLEMHLEHTKSGLKKGLSYLILHLAFTFPDMRKIPANIAGVIFFCHKKVFKPFDH